jgi:hypothetical protein
MNNKLKAKIIEKYGTQSNFAKEYGVSKAMLSKKMHRNNYKQDEINRFIELLNLSNDEIINIFFSQKLKEQNENTTES